MPKTISRASQIKEDTLEDKDGDTKIQVEESSDEDKIRFDTAGTQRMIIDETGQVGVGTDSPSASLDVSGDVNFDGAAVFNESGANKDFRIESDGMTHAFFVDAGTNMLGINTDSPKFLLDIKTNNGGIRLGNTTNSGEKSSNIHFTELASADGLNAYGFSLNYNATDNAFNVMRHNNNTSGVSMMNFSRAFGNIQMGDVDASQFGGTGTPKLWVNADQNDRGIIRCSQHTDDNDPPQFEIVKARGTIESPAAVQSLDYVAQLRAMGHDGTDFQISSDLLWIASDDFTSTSRPSTLTIRTVASGSTSPAERMRITHDGKVGIGTTTPNSKLDVVGDLVLSGSQLKVTSTGPTSLYLQADTDNVTETDTAFIKMTQDGAYLTSYLGYTPNDSQDPEGGSLTDGLANTLLLSCHNSFPGGPPASSRIQLATEQAVRMTIEDDGKVGIGTTTPSTELDVDGDVTVSGQITAATQPAFLARKPSNNQDSFAVGSGVDVTLSTEDFDVGSNFASNTFTAPTTGVYIFTANIYLVDLDTDANYYALDLVTTAGTYRLAAVDPGGFSTDLTQYILGGSIPLLLTAGDTAKIQVYQSGGTQQTSIRGTGTKGTFFAGYLLG